MITITKNGNAVLFEFEENSHYLYNGTIEVPLNSLSLVTDESEMFTFKKAATNDIFISARYDDVNMSKSQLIDFYIANMVGGGGSESGITSGDVESMIETSLQDYYDIDEIDAALSGKADSSAVTQEISAAVSGKVDTSSVYTKSEVDTALNNKQNTLIAGSGITISGNVISAEGGNNVIELTQAEYDALVTGGTVDPSVFYIITDATEINISDYYTSAQTDSAIATYVSGFTYDKATIDSKVASGGTFDPTNYYDKTATDALLDDKFDASAFTSYSAATDARMAEDEEVTAAALNALNDELSSKQNTLVAGENITISGNVISAEGGSITIDPSLDSGSTNPVANSAITNALDSKIQNFWTNSNSQSTIRLAITKNGWSYSDKDLLNLYNGLKTIGASGLTINLNENQEFTSYSAATDALLDDKFDASAFTSYSAATAARMAEDEEVTAAALNALNDELSGKANSSAVTQEIAAAVSGKVDTSAITTSITSSSTNVQVPSAKAVYDKLGGLSLVKLSQVQYEALSPNYDNNTLYVIVG